MIAAKHRTIGHIDFRSAIGFHLHTDNVAVVNIGYTEVYKSTIVLLSSTCFVIDGRCRRRGLRVYLVGTNPIKPVWPLLAIRSISLSVAKTKGSILPSDISITKAQGQISLSPSSSR